MNLPLLLMILDDRQISFKLVWKKKLDNKEFIVKSKEFAIKNKDCYVLKLLLFKINVVLMYKDHPIKINDDKLKYRTVDLKGREIVEVCNFLVTRNILKIAKEKLLIILLVLQVVACYGIFYR